MQGPRINLGKGAILDDLSGIHDDDPVGNRSERIGIVADDQK